MHAAREAARELGGLDIWLGVWERNPRAIAFYVKSGYVQVGSHVFTVGSDSQTDFVFVAARVQQIADRILRMGLPPRKLNHLETIRG